jgi:hypothetical protein
MTQKFRGKIKKKKKIFSYKGLIARFHSFKGQIEDDPTA